MLRSLSVMLRRRRACGGAGNAGGGEAASSFAGAGAAAWAAAAAAAAWHALTCTARSGDDVLLPRLPRRLGSDGRGDFSDDSGESDEFARRSCAGSPNCCTMTTEGALSRRVLLVLLSDLKLSISDDASCSISTSSSGGCSALSTCASRTSSDNTATFSL